MRILITGVNGFIGKALFKNLSKEHEVYGIYHTGEPLSDRCFKVNLIDEIATIDLFENKLNHNIDTLIHLASRMASPNNINDTSVIADNAAIIKNIAVSAKKISVKHIIYFSSSSVYPNIDGKFNESSSINPSPNSDCIYGLSKYNGEVLLNYFLNNSGIIINHLRVAMVYVTGMDVTRLIPVLEKELSDTNQLLLFGNGERFLNLISIDKLSEHIDFFVNNPSNEVINIAEETITVYDLAKRIINQKGNADSIINLKLQGNRNKFILDISKLKSLKSIIS